MKAVMGCHHNRTILAFASVCVLLCGSLRGQEQLTTSTYFQNFNGLANSSTSDNLPDGWVFMESGTNQNVTYTAENGSSTIGDTYSFGTTSSTERSLGGLRSTFLNPTIGVSFTNNTGKSINEITIEYSGEQWRLGSTGRIDRLDFQYSLNATSLTTGTWTDYNDLDFTAPVTAGIIGALDGNFITHKTNITATIAGLSIPVGSIFWIRWNDYAASGSDDGLGIDDFYISATATCTVSITGFAPSGGPAGTIVSMSGTNFIGTSSVYFNGINASFAINSSTSLTATVPSGATSGLITLDNSCTSASSGSFNVLKNSCITGATDLYISEYIEGSSNNKAIEIANFTGNAVNLSGYTLAGYFNGNPSSNLFATLPNVDLPNNQVWVIVPSNATPALLSYANQSTGIAWFNGNDAVVLKKGGVDIDIFGNMGCDPGITWTDGLLQTNDVSLVRKSNAFNGITSNPPPCTFPTLSTGWEQYPLDDYSHLGSHTVIYSTTPPTITSQPGNAVVCVGSSTTLSVGTTGASLYQWKWWNGNSWDNVTNLVGSYSGANTASLIINGSMGLNGVQYYCEVFSTSQCLTNSNAVQLKVSLLPTLSPIYHN